MASLYVMNWDRIARLNAEWTMQGTIHACDILYVLIKFDRKIARI